MSEVKTEPVTAKLVKDIDASSGAGEFEFFEYNDGRVAGMLYRCPCGCGEQRALDFKPAVSPAWDWNGNREAPTLDPSVHWKGHWHGRLQNGVWKSC